MAVGSYEGALLVYKIDLENSIHLRAFSSKDSQGSLKTLLFVGKQLYAGGRDEALRIYNSGKRIQDGALTAQSGTIEKVMRRDEYIFVSTSDGKIVVYGKKDNTFYHAFKPHVKSVIDFDIHASGKLLASYGMDQKLKLIDLATTSEVYHKNMKKSMPNLISDRVSALHCG